jgi:hypothetical protein
MLHLNVLKLYLGKHMLQWSRWLVDSSLSQLSVDATGALSWVTVRAPEARRRLRCAPPQAGHSSGFPVCGRNSHQRVSAIVGWEVAWGLHGGARENRRALARFRVQRGLLPISASDIRTRATFDQTSGH